MATQPMKRSRKVTSRRNKKLAAMSTEYDRQNMLGDDDAGTSGVAHRLTSQYDDHAQAEYDAEVLMGTSSHNSDTDYISDRSSESETDAVAEGSTTAHNCNNHSDIGECLRTWAVVHNQPRSSENEILAIFGIWTDLLRPKDSRTLLKTPKTIGEEIQSIAGGEFWYKGIENNLVNYFKSTVPSIDELSIQVSTDGLPLHRGGPTQLWPILMKIVELPSAPIMMIAVFCGPAKPTSLEVFLRQFVEEANDIHRRGLRIGDKMIKFSIQAIIADSPARAFLKATTYFNGYHGCMRCTCVGEYYEPGKKIIFDSVGAPLRTHHGFKSRDCPGHHQEWRSPLEDLDDFDMVDKLPTSCGLHLCDEGATRRHLCGLVGGSAARLATWILDEVEFCSPDDLVFFAVPGSNKDDAEMMLDEDVGGRKSFTGVFTEALMMMPRGCEMMMLMLATVPVLLGHSR
ncbi:uncharacterized protein LOC121601909 isoform X2 [Anopheles merus]|uniref:uncharacterized protein LOC121601213 isoform X2 n=1 Tax=Anopheles merus TaxID=30066 RepID=UPI001BE3E32E|nr:uncharacterized protein LOC121601213 isoform X2 [Anopheles merus]XP_041786650.1 uncharacterized protein LOC121601909 isoform X2 [Anopheles merus]